MPPVPTLSCSVGCAWRLTRSMGALHDPPCCKLNLCSELAWRAGAGGVSSCLGTGPRAAETTAGWGHMAAGHPPLLRSS
jgi:hypothetical protein